MEKLLRLLLFYLITVSCTEKIDRFSGGEDVSSAYKVGHGMIVLGEKLEDPYSVRNVTKALESLYPTKAGRVEVAATDIYLRFLPKNEAQYNLLIDSGLDLIDHPLDYKIIKDGDYYHDPRLDEGQITWQYAVVAKDFVLPEGVEYEILDECYIPTAATRSDGIDWDAVEEEAYRLTGNGNMILPHSKAGASNPSGRITIIDEKSNGGKPFGVAGVKVVCNSFVKFSSTYTDRDGYYTINRNYSSDLRYRLMFSNIKNFDIGFDLLLVPASSSALGKGSPSGIDFVVDSSLDKKLFCRCVVNNSVHDYYERCRESDMNILPPPKNLRLWLFYKSKSSAALMLKHGAGQLEELVDKIDTFYGELVTALRIFMPDIVLGVSEAVKYSDLYSITCHELAHASHYSKVGNEYWDKYLKGVLNTYVPALGFIFDRDESNSASYEMSETWSYFVENTMFEDRYSEQIHTNGLNYWFKPQIMSSLYEQGFSRAQLFSGLTEEIVSKEQYLGKLIESYPNKKTIVQQVSYRYP